MYMCMLSQDAARLRTYHVDTVADLITLYLMKQQDQQEGESCKRKDKKV